MITEQAYEEVLASLRQRTGVGEGPLSLVSFTIAGVQQFLDSARTTRDVWNGSYLISHLVWRAVQHALEAILGLASNPKREETHRFVLIPAVESQPFWRRWVGGSADQLEIAQFPNVVLLAAPCGEAEAHALARGMEEAVHSSWLEICEAARAPLENLLDGHASQLWNYQLGLRRGQRLWQQVFEIYTAVVELPDAAGLQKLAVELGLDESRGAAGQLFELPMRLLAARKSLRDFEQYAHEGHRCSLCGERSALADDATYQGVRAFWARLRLVKALRHVFREQDRLCAVCTVRRLAPLYYFLGQFPSLRDKIWFPSTSTIAVASWVRQVAAKARDDEELDHAATSFARELRAWQSGLDIEDPPEALVPAFETLQGGLRAFAHCDGRWFYPESYEPELLARDYGVALGRVRQHPAPSPALLAELVERAGSAPDDYFAVVIADGDRMGDWMSGRQDPERFSFDWQQRLSAALAAFAAAARERLERWIPAKVVYAGGDDVLAFAPRRHLLEALAILDLTFDQCIRRPLGYGRDAAPTPSLSVGCVVAKHNDPMKGAIVRAYEQMLKATAKEGLGRNAFAVYRTTEGVAIGAPFDAGGRRTLPYLRALLRAFRNGLSPRVRRHLEELADGLRDWPDPAQLHAARLRLIQRAFQRHFDAPADSRQTALVCRRAGELFECLARWAATQRVAPAVDPFRAFLDLLGLLIFLARHES